MVYHVKSGWNIMQSQQRKLGSIDSRVDVRQKGEKDSFSWVISPKSRLTRRQKSWLLNIRKKLIMMMMMTMTTTMMMMMVENTGLACAIARQPYKVKAQCHLFLCFVNYTVYQCPSVHTLQFWCSQCYWASEPWSYCRWRCTSIGNWWPNPDQWL